MTDSSSTRFSGPALAAFVLGLFAVLANMPLLSPPAALIAIVLAAIGIKQTAAQNISGRNLAVTGLVAGALALFVIPLLNIALSKNQADYTTDARIQANEEQVLAGLHAYAKAQETVLEGGYGKMINPQHEPGYCRDFTLLPEILVAPDGVPTPLLDDAFAGATSEDNPFYGYYFAQGPVSETAHVLYAFPVVYGKTGRRTFRIDHTGTILGCDLGSQHTELSTSLDQLQWQPVFMPQDASSADSGNEISGRREITGNEKKEEK